MGLFNVAAGVYVPNQWKLSEGFEISTVNNRTRVRANISLERLGAFFLTAVCSLYEPVFLILESPSNEVKELELRKTEGEPYHTDVFYSELTTRDKLTAIFSKYEELLINDGFIRFGAASQKTKDEIFVAYYKVVHLLGTGPIPFEQVLERFEIPKTEHLVTAWDLFTQDSPGTKSRYEPETGDIYHMLECLIRNGTIFFAKTVEE
ncbi:MAG: hypothetical protein QOI34_627 [Verrucomicrobiota bacterium]